MDDKLSADAKKGNSEALAQLLYLNYEIVFRYLVKLTLSTAAAEDITQETMARAIGKFELYDPAKAKFSTWLISIAQNIYVDYLRKKKREQRYVDEDAASRNDLNLPVEGDDSFGSVLEALGKLSEDIRFPVLLKHYYGYSYEEIASVMSIPLGTVKSRIHNGLKFLRKELGMDERERQG